MTSNQYGPMEKLTTRSMFDLVKHNFQFDKELGNSKLAEFSSFAQFNQFLLVWLIKMLKWFRIYPNWYGFKLARHVLKIDFRILIKSDTKQNYLILHTFVCDIGKM